MTHKQNIQEIISIAIQNYDIKNHKEDFTPYTYTTLSGRTETIYVIELTQKPTFIKKIEEAKATIKDTAKWRVDVPSIEDLEDTRIFQTLNGGTFAIKKDGDIVNVCAKMGDEGYSLDNMESVMAYAVNECDGTKLDSFDGNWSFYRKCGFEPRTWIGFNEDIGKSLGWVKGRDLPEPVVFMEYTGNKKRLGKSEIRKERTDFYAKNKEITMDSAIEGEEYEYDVAYRVRDDMMKADNKQKNIMPKYSTILKVIEKSINKTHDGTSMGTLRNNLKDFIEKYGDDEKRVEQVVSSDGNILKTRTQKVSRKNREKQLMNGYDENTDSHLIIKQSDYSSRNGITWEGDNDYYDFFEKGEMEHLLTQNSDDEDVFRSITKINSSSEGNASITLIKSNDFNPEKYQELCDKLPKGVQDFEQEKFNFIVEESHKWGVEQGSRVGGTDAGVFPGFDEELDKISDKCDEKYGFVGDYVESNFGDLIEESGVKLRLQKNENL